MNLFRRSTRADRHKAAGDEYVRDGGDPAVRAAVDRGAASGAASRQQIEAARAELRRMR